MNFYERENRWKYEKHIDLDRDIDLVHNIKQHWFENLSSKIINNRLIAAIQVVSILLQMKLVSQVCFGFFNGL